MPTRGCSRRPWRSRRAWTRRRWWRATSASAARGPSRGEPRRVFVLSRVTLGADVAVTSVLLAAAKRRFPNAEIVFVGPRKNYELFAADPRIASRRRGVPPRQPARAPGRLGRTEDAAGRDPDCLVIDPDSRLTQLGLLPVCPEDRYHLFESRAYGGDGDRHAAGAGRAVGATKRSASRTPQPYVAVGRPPAGAHPVHRREPGSGREPGQAHRRSVRRGTARAAGATGLPLVIDKGAGGEEAARVERAVERSGAAAQFWDGTFAGFAEIIAGSSLYVGYDSAGQHVAAACGVPLISIFAGFPAPRMFDRWRPAGALDRDPRGPPRRGRRLSNRCGGRLNCEFGEPRKSTRMAGTGEVGGGFDRRGYFRGKRRADLPRRGRPVEGLQARRPGHARSLRARPQTGVGVVQLAARA